MTIKKKPMTEKKPKSDGARRNSARNHSKPKRWGSGR
jgi:hypothetical protein